LEWRPGGKELEFLRIPAKICSLENTKIQQQLLATPKEIQIIYFDFYFKIFNFAKKMKQFLISHESIVLKKSRKKKSIKIAKINCKISSV
jgi:hypothetical protein